MMEKTDETIPSREELAVFIEEAAVSVTNNYEEAPAVLMVDDAVIGTLGNFSASIGKAKSKKTFNVSAIAASALSGRTVLRYRSMFPENKRKILYIIFLVIPPSITMFAPLMKSFSGADRNMTIRAMSSGTPTLPDGCCL